jgi:hypothetical protein
MASQVQRMGYIALFGKIRLKKLPTPRTMPPSMHEQERGQAGILFRLLRDNFETCHSGTGSGTLMNLMLSVHSVWRFLSMQEEIYWEVFRRDGKTSQGCSPGDYSSSKFRVQRSKLHES